VVRRANEPPSGHLNWFNEAAGHRTPLAGSAATTSTRTAGLTSSDTSLKPRSVVNGSARDARSDDADGGRGGAGKPGSTGSTARSTVAIPGDTEERESGAPSEPYFLFRHRSGRTSRLRDRARAAEVCGASTFTSHGSGSTRRRSRLPARFGTTARGGGTKARLRFGEPTGRVSVRSVGAGQVGWHRGRKFTQSPGQAPTVLFSGIHQNTRVPGGGPSDPKKEKKGRCAAPGLPSTRCIPTRPRQKLGSCPTSVLDGKKKKTFFSTSLRGGRGEIPSRQAAMAVRYTGSLPTHGSARGSAPVRAVNSGKKKRSQRCTRRRHVREAQTGDGGRQGRGVDCPRAPCKTYPFPPSCMILSRCGGWISRHAAWPLF